MLNMHAFWNTVDVLSLQEVYSNSTQTWSFIIYSLFPTPYDILSSVEKRRNNNAQKFKEKGPNQHDTIPHSLYSMSYVIAVYEKDSNLIIH